MTTKPGKLKPGQRPQPRVKLDMGLPPPGADHASWAARLVSDLIGHPTIKGWAKLRIDAGPTADLLLLGPAIVELLSAARIIDPETRVTDIAARVNKTIPNDQVRIEVAATRKPADRMGEKARQKVRERTLARWAQHRAAKTLAQGGMRGA